MALIDILRLGYIYKCKISKLGISQYTFIIVRQRPALKWKSVTRAKQTHIENIATTQPNDSGDKIIMLPLSNCWQQKIPKCKNKKKQIF